MGFLGRRKRGRSLDEEEKAQLARLYAIRGFSQDKLARRFGVSQATVQKALKEYHNERVTISASNVPILAP